MAKLEKTWIFDGLMDLEYKQYILLAYLKKVERDFDEMKLYPAFSDLLYHYDYLFKIKNANIKHNKSIKNLLDLEIKESNDEALDRILSTATVTPVINEIIDYALDEILEYIKRGKFMYDEVEKCLEINKLSITQVGSDGYFIIKGDEILVYEYSYGKISKRNNGRILKTRLVKSYPNDLEITIESIKTDLLNSSDIESPTIFLIESAFKYPIEETILPIAKRFLLKKLVRHQIS